MSSAFGVDFGQKVDLTASIRNILRNYPEGTAILKELIQNADDANATVVTFILDYRYHSCESLADQSLHCFQGPSLLIYNNAIFTEEDFKSIQRIGDSLKKSESNQTKIGRFGIGFNAVYHWTDLPSFISNRYLVLLDPQAKYLPHVNPSNPGKMVDWYNNPSIIAQYQDQFRPYIIDGINNFTKLFDGTLFRLPLRTKEQASSSLLSKRALTVVEANELLKNLQEEASSMLLFLKNITKINIKIFPTENRYHDPSLTSSYSSDGSSSSSSISIGGDVNGYLNNQPILIYSCEISNYSKDMMEKRYLMSNKSQLDQLHSKIDYHCAADYTVVIRCIDNSNNNNYDDNNNNNNNNNNSELTTKNPKEYWEVWEVCNQLGGLNANMIAFDNNNLSLRLVPWAGVAACVMCSNVMVNELNYYELKQKQLLQLMYHRSNGHSRSGTTTISGSSSSSSSSSSSLHNDDDDDDDDDSNYIRLKKYTDNGLAYCFLPLPIRTGLPVMVNGFFELSSNRRDVWQGGADMTGDGRTRALWNISLMHDIIAPSYCRLLLRVRDILDFSIQYQQLWPSYHVNEPWKAVVTAVLELLKSQKVLKVSNRIIDDHCSESRRSSSSSNSNNNSYSSNSICNSVSQNNSTSKRSSNNTNIEVVINSSLSLSSSLWISCDDAVLLPKKESVSSLSTSDETELSSYLLQTNVRLIECEEVLKCTLIDSKTCTIIATPSYLRNILRYSAMMMRSSSSSQLSTISSSLQGTNNNKSTIISNIKYDNNNNRIFTGIPTAKACKFLIHYCLSDINLSSSSTALSSTILNTTVCLELDILPILPTLNNFISSLRIYTIQQSNLINELTTAMGFPLTNVIKMINKFKDNNNNNNNELDLMIACEYLTSDNNNNIDSNYNRNNTNNNTSIMGTNNNNNNINSSISSRANVYTAEDNILLVLDDAQYEIFKGASSVILNKNYIAPNELEILTNKHMQKISNIRLFDVQFIPDLLRYILPSACFNNDTVLLTEIFHNDADNDNSDGSRSSSSSINDRISEFIRLFWQYAQTRPSVITVIAQGTCIVPTENPDALYPLSRLSNLIAQQKGDVVLPQSIKGMILIKDMMMMMMMMMVIEMMMVMNIVIIKMMAMATMMMMMKAVADMMIYVLLICVQ